MSVLIIGASGFVGGELMKAFGRAAIGTYHRTPTDGLHPLDITDPDAVEALIARVQPTVIVHPAAQPNVERCEIEPEESHAVNVVGTANVARAARRIGARFVYFSTDYLFDGTAGPYAPDAPPKPVQVYGRHKLEAEQAIRDVLDNYLIVRICGVYGYHPTGKNFVMGLIGRARRGEAMQVPSDQWGTPTFVESLAEAVRELAHSTHIGAVHPVGPDYLSRIAFAETAAEMLGFDTGFLEPRTTEQLRQHAQRPLKGGVDNRSTQALLTTRLASVREGLAIVRRQMDTDRAQ